MSWGISIKLPIGKTTHYCDECSHTHEGESYKRVFDQNYTSNMSPMLQKAGFDWDYIEGKTGTDSLPFVQDLIEKMELDADEYRALNPANGWGDYDTFYFVLIQFRRALEEYPSGIVYISR